MFSESSRSSSGARRARSGYGSAGSAVATTPAAAFLARTSGLDATHINAYTALINGLVTDSVWSKLDVLHIYATKDSATALLNLKSSSFNGTSHGSPTFAADLGFTGSAGSTTIYIDSGFNPITASSPQFTQNSAHLSFWNLTNAGTAQSNIGSQSGITDNYIYAKYSGDNKNYTRINCDSNLGTNFPAPADPRGHVIGNRPDANSLEQYINGARLNSAGSGSTAMPNTNIVTLGTSSLGTVSGNSDQIAMASIGGGLTPTDMANFYTRLRTYMTAVGVP